MAVLGLVPSPVRRQSNRNRATRDWRLDVPVPDSHSLRYTAAEAAWYDGADPTSPHVGTFRLLLRMSAPVNLSVVRQETGLGDHTRRFHDTPLLCRRSHRFRADDSTCHHFDSGMDPASGWRALAIVASTDLCQLDCRGISLLLARQVHCSGADLVRDRRGRTAGLPLGSDPH